MALPGALTDPAAVRGERTSYPSGGRSVPAYLARPAAGGSRGGLIVIHEAFGPVEHIDDLARRFAGAGFDAIAPDLYHRDGAPDPTDMGSVMAKMFGLADGDAIADLEAAAAHLRSLDSSNGKVGVLGFCSGGRQTLLLACSSSVVDAAAPCWGGFIDRATPDAETTAERPVKVIDLAGQAHCPLYVVGGVEDQNPSPEVLRELGSRLAAAGRPAEVEIFDDAGHAFLADYRPSYREGPAHALWPKLVSFFQAHLG
ncbi:MAG: dienelactone hydrolase family protein [Acidimicrobiia bacterium]|nr:dienelactone hydrolase family protein [Acidimicrobiia bacterium]